MGSEAKKYLQNHKIPQLFEGLMTGLIYNKPEDPIVFLETSIAKIKQEPSLALKWDSFVDSKHHVNLKPAAYPLPNSNNEKILAKNESAGTAKKSEIIDIKRQQPASSHSSKNTTSTKNRNSPKIKSEKSLDSPTTNRERCTSVMKAAESAQIPDVPIILFMGGPGGGKTKHAEKVSESMENKGLIHICMPDLIKMAVKRYADKYPEWKNANEKYSKGELIPNYLALQLIKAEMGRYPNAKAFFLEGFPREAQQVEDFEREVAPVNMALILDYDESTLRNHMDKRGLSQDIINCKINEFKKKTLPSAKYFDDQGLLHLIPGESSNEDILEKICTLVNKAIETGIPIYTSSPHVTNISAKSPSSHASTKQPSSRASVKSNRVEKSPSIEDSKSLEKESETLKSISRQTSSKSVASRTASRTSNKSINSPSSSKVERSVNNVVENKGIEKIHNEKENASPLNINKTPTPDRKDKVESAKNSPVHLTTHIETPKQVEEVQSNSPMDEKVESVQANKIIKKKVDSPLLSNTRPSTMSQRPPTTDKHTVAAVIERDDNSTPKEKGSSASTLTARDAITLNVPVILIIGPPGSNKYEIAKKISQKYEGFMHISMGALLRNMVKENEKDELWQRIGKKMDIGEMIPMKICRELLFTALNEHSSTSWGFVIEGYPRSLPQLSDYETHGIRLDLAILIDCTEQFCTEVLNKRFENGQEKRLDDDPEVVKSRLEHFKQNNLPMLKALDDTGKLRVVRIEYKIDGDVEPVEIFNTVTEMIDGTLFVEENNAGKGLSSENSNNTYED